MSYPCGLGVRLFPYVVGYGVVGGLVLPLMISSVFLQEMSLSHGAGGSFGLLFFGAYTATLAADACIGLARRKRMPATTNRMLATVGLALAFVGNFLMLLRTSGTLELGYAQTLAMGLTIGGGLALAETGWLRLVSCAGLVETRPMMMLLGAGTLLGCLVAAIIFLTSGVAELVFALAIIVLSAVFVRSVPVDGMATDAPVFPVTLKASLRTSLIKSTVCLAVFSFVFGAVGQMSSVSAYSGDAIVTEIQALAGVGVAALAAVVASPRITGLTAGDLYWRLFPVASITLVVLPFFASPLIHAACVALVFMSYCLTGVLARVVACRMQGGPGVSISLCVGGACLLAGVEFGSVVLTSDNSGIGLSAVSLVSLFVLSLSPLLLRAMGVESTEAKGGVLVDHESQVPAAPGPVERPAHGSGRDEALRRACAELGLTQRETDVLQLICIGRTRGYIAESLGISPNTVKGYIHSVYQKAGVTNKQDLIDRMQSFERNDQK